MSSKPYLATCALAAACLGGGAAPAAAAARAGASAAPAAGAHGARATHAVRYRGRTRHGDPITFVLTGSRVSRVHGWAPTLCLAIEGMPLSGTDAFDPPGAFPLGRQGEVKALRHNSMWVTSDVTKHFTLTAKRGRGGRITGRLHSDFSFLQLLFTYPISSRPYVCTGDTTFTASLQR